MQHFKKVKSLYTSLKKLLCFFIFLLLHFIILQKSAARENKKIDSLKFVIKTTTDELTRINADNILSETFWNNGDYSNAKLYAQNALLLCKKMIPICSEEKRCRVVNYSMAEAYNNIGIVETNQGNYTEALRNHLEALTIYEATDDKKNIAATNNDIGTVYMYQANYPNALKCYLSSLKIKEELNDTYGIAFTYNNIGIVYYRQGNFIEALKNYFASLKIRQKINDDFGIADSYVSIGTVYLDQKNFTDALKYHLNGLKIYENIREKKGAADTYGNMGIIYSGLKNYKEAFLCLQKSLTIYEELEDKEGLAASYVNMGKIKIDLKEYDGAGKLILQGIQIAKTIGAKNDLAEGYGDLATLDSIQKKWQSSFENFKKYIVYRDSLVNEENTRKTIQAQMSYEFDKRENAFKAEQEKQSALSATESRKQKIIIFSVIVGLLLTIIFAAFVFRSLQLNKKKNALITYQKQLVEEKQKEILDSIYYARRIQRAIMPSEKQITKILKKIKKEYP